jgi:glycosyltransferase involved in cell wall biosynthesis
MATFTIIIPFYQRDDGILRRALASAFSQSFQDFEVIVVDDQSPYLPADELRRLTQARAGANHRYQPAERRPGRRPQHRSRSCSG